MARGERKLRVTVLGDDRGGKKVLHDLGNEADQRTADKTDGLGRRMQGLGGNAATMGAKLSVGLTAPLALVGKALFDASSDMNESLSKSNTIFAEQGAPIEKWATGAAKGFGQSKQSGA